MLNLLARIFGNKSQWEITESVIDVTEVPSWVPGSDESEPEPLVLVIG